jgi:hypothetical protein
VGTEISLRIGKLDIDWGRNEEIRNHSAIFLPADRKMAKYFYADSFDIKPALSRKLGAMLGRLALLGYSERNLKKIFNAQKQTYNRYEGGDIGYEYDEVVQTLRSCDLVKMGNNPMSEQSWATFLERHGNRHPAYIQHDKKGLLVTSQLLGSLDPYWLLVVFAGNKRNLNRDVVWGYYDSVESGYFKERELLPNTNGQKKYLIVTEGSSDSVILRKAIDVIRPDISDFFDFIDMKDNYPFTGTGELVRFATGLAKIGFNRQTTILFDNDAEGRFALNKLRSVKLPSNFKILRLPDHPTFKKVRTSGPNGIRRANINGRAVAIESFLDLSYESEKRPVWSWKSVHSSSKVFQGALESKESYTKRFLNWKSGKYDLRKLTVLVDMIVQECSKTF